MTTMDTNLPINRTLTVGQVVALREHLSSLDSDAFPMDDDLLGALLAATGALALSREVTNVFQGALECALWLGMTIVWADEQAESESCDLRDRAEEVPAAVLESLREDVQTFLAQNADLLEVAISLYNLSSDEDREWTVGEQIGHDFMLTRNGHGAGFWDRGLGEVGDYLTANCRPYGEWGLEADAEQIYGPS